jgi:hypothetical protein
MTPPPAELERVSFAAAKNKAPTSGPAGAFLCSDGVMEAQPSPNPPVSLVPIGAVVGPKIKPAHMRRELLLFENLVDQALLSHRSEEVFRQITNFLIARRCL